MLLAPEKNALDVIPEISAEKLDPFFYGGHWGQCLDLVTHLCQYSESILLVIGSEGTGKSSLKEALKLRCAAKFDFYEHNTDADLDASIFNNTASPSKDLVLVLDDAQNMPEDMIPALFKLKPKVNFMRRLHIVLFALPEFEHTLQQIAAKQRCAEQLRVIEIETLTLAEVEAFLLHNWRLAGNLSDLPLDKVRCKKIFSLTAGNPGAVQKVANDLLEGKNISKLKIDHSSLSPLVVGSIVALGALSCVLAFLWPTAQDFSPVSEKAPLIEKIENLEPVLETPVIAAEQASAAAEEQVSVTSPIISIEEQKIASLEETISELQQQLLDEQQARHALEAKLQTALQKNQIQVVKPKAKKSLAVYSEQEKYLLDVPSSNYAIQLLGAGNEAKIKAFIAENGLSSKAYYFRTTYKSRAWFIVVLGNYATKDLANADLRSLPDNLKKLRPWPREYKTIHEIIKKKANHE